LRSMTRVEDSHALKLATGDAVLKKFGHGPGYTAPIIHRCNRPLGGASEGTLDGFSISKPKLYMKASKPLSEFLYDGSPARAPEKMLNLRTHLRDTCSE
jgi:hypothetical protein